MTPADIRAFRARWGLSQRALAAELGVANYRTVQRWEAGDIDVPGPAALAMALIDERGALPSRWPIKERPDPQPAPRAAAART